MNKIKALSHLEDERALETNIEARNELTRNINNLAVLLSDKEREIFSYE